jgi:hypothetical protein
VLDTNTSPQGSGNNSMSKNFSKSVSESAVAILESTGSNGNGNGKAKETVVIEEAVAEVVAEVVKPEAPVTVPEVKAAPVISVERRIEKVEELKITIKKYQQLQEARKGLTNFRLGSDGMSAVLTLKDADGTPFSTSNPVVLETALNHIRQVLNEKIHETEQEINFSV